MSFLNRSWTVDAKCGTVHWPESLREWLTERAEHEAITRAWRRSS